MRLTDHVKKREKQREPLSKNLRIMKISKSLDSVA
jgi:hypothetical protein